ncbi:hypothetical protein OAF11_03245, partial [Akkermansiaceae bacterium]|nr:hypothetical protein [Akkermansiaceae bacterium]
FKLDAICTSTVSDGSALAGGRSKRTARYFTPSSQIGLPAGVTLQSIKLYLDTAKVPGWNQIDAVELRTVDGKKHWATTATASSSWSK